MTEEERRKRAAEQETRALQALESIMQGGDLGKESLELSNEYSDGLGARFSAWVRGLRRPRS